MNRGSEKRSQQQQRGKRVYAYQSLVWRQSHLVSNSQYQTHVSSSAQAQSGRSVGCENEKHYFFFLSASRSGICTRERTYIIALEVDDVVALIDEP